MLWIGMWKDGNFYLIKSYNNTSFCPVIIFLNEKIVIMHYYNIIIIPKSIVHLEPSICHLTIHTYTCTLFIIDTTKLHAGYLIVT